MNHDRIATSICQTVAEIPDRSSPDDQPEMMLVTADELITIVLCALESEAEIAASERRDNLLTGAGRWEIDDEGRVFHRPDALTKYVIAQMESGTAEYENLVLAAPQLLEALTIFMDHGDLYDARGQAIARAAIAKAHGEVA